jgi:glycosyltransferase involved in cell wall biosynthesis
MRVYTCTPMCFRGDLWFFTRESGLFSHGLRALGIDSMSVMPGPSKPDDTSDLIRVPYSKLESPAFWQSLSLDGLILYSWAAPRYLPIAEAVQASGIPFLVNVDHCGLVSRPANPRVWRRDLVPYLFATANSPTKALRCFARIVDNLGIYRVARKRLATYETATAVSGVSPMATLWLQNEARGLGRSHLVKRVHYLPHPQMRHFSYSGEPKQNLVLSVARWQRADWPQKNPAVLLDALDQFLNARFDWRACIIGSGATNLAKALGRLQLAHLDRFEFIDFLKPEELLPYYDKAKIACWSSRSEGQIGTGAQALCCGCSVVSGNAGTLSCFHHYVSQESGRLALGMDADALAEALQLEARAWDDGQRDPTRISRIWCDEFHDVKVASRALALLGLQR